MSSASQPDIRAFLADKDKVLILDGALATELEARGCDLLDPLWSGKVLLENPSLIEEVECAYLQAGARCLITASYQATPQALQEQRGLDEATAADAVANSVRLAQAARRAFCEAQPMSTDPIYVAGSVGPYGAYLADGSEYRGDYTLSEEGFQAFHRPRIAALVSAGVDVLALETQPSAAEVRALVRLLEREFPGVLCWVSFTLREPADPSDPVSQIADGTSLAEVAAELEASPRVVAVGFNCVPLRLATRALTALAATGIQKPLVMYPNSGEVYDPVTKTWHQDERLAKDEGSLAAHAEAWMRAGARLVGGCCRSGPADIAALQAALEKRL